MMRCRHPLSSLTSPLILKHVSDHTSFWRSQCLLLWPCGVTATFRQTDRLQLNVSSLLPPRTQATDRLSTSEANPEQEVCGRRKGDVWNENNSCLETLNMNFFYFLPVAFSFFFILINCCSEKRLCSFLYFHLPINKQWGVPLNGCCWGPAEPHEQTLHTGAPWTDPPTATLGTTGVQKG